MRVVLTKNIPKVGKAGEIKRVSDGFARNFLFAQGLAKPATDKNIKNFKYSQEKSGKGAMMSKEKLEKLQKRLQGLNLKLAHKANNQGHLFAGVKIEEVKSALKKNNIEIKAKDITFPQIKEIGKFKIQVKLSADKKVKVSLEIIAE